MKNNVITGVIVLTSAGLKIPEVASEVLKRLPSEPKSLKLAHIVTAANVASDVDFMVRDVEVMKKLGFGVTDVELEGKNESELYALLKDFDIIYVQGGNGFYLLKHIRESGFENVARKLLDEGKWYVGVSAGTYVCCPTIEMHNWKRAHDDWYGLTDLKAMNLVPFLVSVHYDREKYREKLAENIPNASADVRILKDTQAFFVENGKVELIGEKPEVLATDILN